MNEYEPILLRNVGKPNVRQLDAYRATGGYEGAVRALAHTPDEVIDVVKRANLRGRGGAGFPAGVKWSFLPKERDITYLCVNADESEPPTFSNRVLMEEDPHQLLEGILIAGYATQATVAYLYMRAEFAEQFHIMQKALDEAYHAGYFGKNILNSGYDLECYIHRGAGAYVCGEETGLIESLEGKRGWPRIKPPFPAIQGAFGKPTVVNNVETLANLPHIIQRGADWFMGIGPEGSSGPKLFCISGAVNKPGCYEWSMDITVRDLIEDDRFGGGMRDGLKVKAVMPGGISMGILTADELDMKMDFSDPANYGLLGLGTSSAIVIDEHTDIRKVLRNVARFYAHESCGQCTQCREGTSWMYKIANRVERGLGRAEDIELLGQIPSKMGMMPGLSICGLSDGATFAIRTIVEKFRSELEGYVGSVDDEVVRIALEIAN
ncbi:MAG: NADH-quinone oxidoreductase subunit NuoF [Planctomycetes bacterium]|nr:NADH-quinone oxidoreductase subunit NuoF [Planctomycetota bacterium]